MWGLMHHTPRNCVQATPDYAPLFIVAQVSGAPDTERLGSVTFYEKLNHHPDSHVSYHCNGWLQQGALEWFHHATAWQQRRSGFRW